MTYRNGGEGGILTRGIKLSYNHFNNMHGTRMNIGDFHDLALCNSFNSFA